MFGRNQSVNETGLIADLLLNFRPDRTILSNRSGPFMGIKSLTKLNNENFRKECSMISLIKPSPFWHKVRFQAYFMHIFEYSTSMDFFLCPVVHGALMSMYSWDLNFWNRHSSIENSSTCFQKWQRKSSLCSRFIICLYGR